MTRLALRKDSAQYSVSAGPDVCDTPMGSSMVPVAYTSVAFYGDAVRTANTVRINGKPAVNVDSRVKKTTGTEPGVGGGVSSGGHIGPAKIPVGSSTLNFQGRAATRDGDEAQLNLGSME